MWYRSWGQVNASYRQGSHPSLGPSATPGSSPRLFPVSVCMDKLSVAAPVRTRRESRKRNGRRTVRYVRSCASGFNMENDSLVSKVDSLVGRDSELVEQMPRYLGCFGVLVRPPNQAVSAMSCCWCSLRKDRSGGVCFITGEAYNPATVTCAAASSILYNSQRKRVALWSGVDLGVTLRLSGYTGGFPRPGPMDPPPAAYVAITPVETGKDSVPGVEGSRCEREPRLASCSVRAKLVARGRAPRPAHGLARGVLRRAGCAPAHAVLTSTHRTARCGPACLVVWEGKDRDRRSSPIPIVSKVLRRPPDLRLGGCACPTRRSAGRPGQMLLDDLTPIGNPAGFGWKTMRLVSSQGACLPLREDLICPCHVSNGERTVCTVP